MIDVDRNELVRWRRALHKIPELGTQEEKTAAFLEQELQAMGLSPERLTETGMQADIAGTKDGPTVLVRADMDGLPLTEASGEPFQSEHPGVMHACGHDGHMSIALGTARWFAGHRDFGGRIRLLFQPSEERIPGGALPLIEAGCLAGVDAVLGLHVWATLPVGSVWSPPGVMMANADEFRIVVRGRGGHGSEPHRTKDAVLIASSIVVALQTIVSRRVDPMVPAVVTCGALRAGSTFNIIAETAEIQGTVRTLDQDTKATVVREMQRIVENVAASFGAEAELDYRDGYPAVVNHAAVATAWTDALAADGIAQAVTMPPSLGAEDFAYYLRERPGAFLFLGARPEGETYPHHSPHFRFHEDALPIGVAALVSGANVLLTRPDLLARTS
jgi:amidohydrolase